MDNVIGEQLAKTHSRVCGDNTGETNMKKKRTAFEIIEASPYGITFEMLLQKGCSEAEIERLVSEEKVHSWTHTYRNPPGLKVRYFCPKNWL
jgi:hypothetical protein